MVIEDMQQSLEYLEFVEKILEKEKEDEQSRTLEH